jgi:hypothetical protein
MVSSRRLGGEVGGVECVNGGAGAWRSWRFVRQGTPNAGRSGDNDITSAISVNEQKHLGPDNTRKKYDFWKRLLELYKYRDPVEFHVRRAPAQIQNPPSVATKSLQSPAP